jgi:hypothetical protein
MPKLVETTMPSEKECRVCCQVLPAVSFAVEKAKRGRQERLATYCKLCAVEKNREWQRIHPESNKRRKERFKEKHGNEYWIKYADPTKVKARRIAKEAVRTGRLEKPSDCSRCGAENVEPRLLQAHHPDYSKPLEVEWLCSMCHGGEHGRSA